LNEILKRQALLSDGEWTEDIATMRWRHDPQYCDSRGAERLRLCTTRPKAVAGVDVV
jgi:hypothetical protein